jgi:hypothetical protein
MSGAGRAPGCPPNGSSRLPDRSAPYPGALFRRDLPHGRLGGNHVAGSRVVRRQFVLLEVWSWRTAQPRFTYRVPDRGCLQRMRSFSSNAAAAPRGRWAPWISRRNHERDIKQRRPPQPGHPGQDRREARVAVRAGVAAGHAAAFVRPVRPPGKSRQTSANAPLPAVENARSIAAARFPLLKIPGSAKARVRRRERLRGASAFAGPDGEPSGQAPHRPRVNESRRAAKPAE